MFPKNARSGASLALTLVALCAPLAAIAADKTSLEPDIVVEQDWDSNIFETTNNPQGSMVTIVRPALRFSDVGETGFFRAGGWLASNSYWEESKLNGVDRGISLDFDEKLSRRWSAFGSGSLQYLAAHNEIRANDTVTSNSSGQPIVTPGQVLEGNVPDVNIDQGIGGIRYELTPLSTLSFSGGPYSVRYGQSDAGGTDNRNRDGWTAGVDLTHRLTTMDTVSLGVDASNTDQQNVSFLGVEGLAFQPTLVELQTGKSVSDQQSINLGWTRTWNEAWSTDVTLGVRRLHTRSTDVSTPATGVTLFFIPLQSKAFALTDFDDTSPLVVGEIRVARTFLRSALSLGFTRETRSASSGATSDVNVSTFDLLFTHRLAERVTLRLNGSWEFSENANDTNNLEGASYIQGSFDPVTGPKYECPTGKLIVTGSGPDKIGQCEVGGGSTLRSQSLLLSARLDWQLRKRLGTFAVFRYYDRSGDQQLFGNDYNKFNFGVGFRYFYDLDL